MSEIEEMETNNKSFLNGVTDYTKMRDREIEHTIKEGMEIGITDKLKELYVYKEVVETLTEKFTDEELLIQLEDVGFFVNNLICKEITDDVFVS